MNERMLELYRQAQVPHTAIDPSNNMPYETTCFSAEKFAELIVRECVKSTLSLRDAAIDNEWNLDETFHMIVDTIVEDLDMQHIFRS
jgi:hypothetical protein